MAESHDDGPIAPRRSLGGPILPPPPPELATEKEQARSAEAEAREAEAAKQALREAQRVSREQRLAERDAERKRRAEQQAREKAEAKARKEQQRAVRQQSKEPKPAKQPARASQATPPAQSFAQSGSPVVSGSTRPSASSGRPAGSGASTRRTRRAQLRLVQVDAWSVMKTSFLLSIALGIVLVVAVAIMWAVLGAAGVWDSINSIVQQAVGTENGTPFDIEDYVGTSRVLGFTMIVAVIDVILITAIATLGAFLYNLSAALLGGIEVTLAEDD